MSHPGAFNEIRWSNRTYFHNRPPRKRRGFGSPRLVCVNCGSEGHILRDCNEPTTSFGIIAVRRHYPGMEIGPIFPATEYRCPKHEAECPDEIPEAESPSNASAHGLLFLMVQRKDTMGFIDLIRGKYPSEEPRRTEMLRTYFSEMTCDERRRLRMESFQEIWDVMWRNHASKSYISEYPDCRRKFERLDVGALLDQTECCWSAQEFGFPKGRKNIRETDQSAAIREFVEESGYKRHEIRMCSDVPFEEDFRGTNGVRYKHVYYLAEVSKHVHPPRMDPTNIQQVGEIRNVGWFTLDQCLSIIRPYDIAKKELLIKVHESLRDVCCPQ